MFMITNGNDSNDDDDEADNGDDTMDRRDRYNRSADCCSKNAVHDIILGVVVEAVVDVVDELRAILNLSATYT